MKFHRRTLSIATHGKGFTDVTREIASVVRESGVEDGLVSIYVLHTSASLLIQENADASVRRDLERYFARMVPEDARYEHDAEGPDDMPSHIRSTLTRTSETIPVAARELHMGTWQALYLWEHRIARQRRELCVTVMGT